MVTAVSVAPDIIGLKPMHAPEPHGNGASPGGSFATSTQPTLPGMCSRRDGAFSGSRSV